MGEILDFLRPLTRFAIVAAIATLVLWGAQRALNKAEAKSSGNRYRKPLIMLCLTLLALIALVIAMPIENSTEEELLRLLGLLLSAAIALSSTTILSNGLAGLMLHTLRNFKIGDFIRVDDNFGRVTERGLFHTEIQTEDRDLVTLPNLMLVTSAVRHLRSSGTIVSTTVSLGYDIQREKIEACLIEAATKAELEDAFVQVRELGDFSISYRVSGLLVDVKHILTMRSDLAKQVLDALHAAQIEIVSPTVMSTRVLGEHAALRPKPSATPAPEAPASQPEALVFDKADEAENLESRRKRGAELLVEIEELRAQRDAAEAGSERERLEGRLTRMTELKSALDSEVKAREKLLRHMDEE